MAASVDEFVRTVLRSGVLDRDRLKDALRAIPPQKRERAEGVADCLVAGKLLTSFQAKKLLAGAAVGLRLGPFVIQSPVGKGGMGTVYLARDTRTGNAVAIKVLSPQRIREGERHLVRFQREMALSKRMRHPNIAMAADVGEVQGVHYLALEFIPGVTLFRLVARDGPLPPARAARLFVEIASALEYAHAQGLVHRDIKPTNIMVTPDDHAKVLDLGLALIEGEQVDDPELLGRRGYIVGSVEYIAPEQTRDPTQVDARADLYSFGCTMYFALTGRGPFSFGDAKDKIRAHRQLDAEPIDRRNPAVPAGLAALIHRLMAKDPAKRPASAAAVRRELLAFSEPAKATASLYDSAISFEILGDFDEDNDAPDTLGEAFEFGTREVETESGEPLLLKSDIRTRLKNRSSSGGKMWLVATSVALAILILVLVVVMTNLPK